MRITSDQIRSLRARHGLTQQQLADSLYGVKKERVTDWETGRRGCPQLIAWAMILLWDSMDIRDSAQLEAWKEKYAL